MARLRRPPYTVPVPAKAEIVTHNGKRCARFKGKDGKTIVAPLNADGTRCQRQSKKWYGEYRDANGELQCVPLSTDKISAQQMLSELIRKIERKKAKLGDPFEAHTSRPLAEHLDDYRRFLEAEGNCCEHVVKTVARIQRILDGCEFVFIYDLSAEKVADFLYRLRRDPSRPIIPEQQEWFTPKEMRGALGGDWPSGLAAVLRREGLSAQKTGRGRRYPRATVQALQDLVCRGISISTSNGYLTAIKGLSRWLVKSERIDRDRLVSLKRLNADTDPRHKRRAMPQRELQNLLATTGRSDAVVMGLTGLDRQMLYGLAMTTGFRASELGSLAIRNFDLDASPPTATVQAAYSKNRRVAVQPLPLDVTKMLRRYLGTRPTDLRVWPGDWSKNAAKMLRADLLAAGIPYRDADGRVADFHALRHSYITLLERSGVSPKLAQELARHSDIRLTMNVYTHAALYDLGAAVEGLPTLLPSDDKDENAARTGT
jgi:integrase